MRLVVLSFNFFLEWNITQMSLCTHNNMTRITNCWGTYTGAHTDKLTDLNIIITLFHLNPPFSVSLTVLWLVEIKTCLFLNQMFVLQTTSTQTFLSFCQCGCKVWKNQTRLYYWIIYLSSIILSFLTEDQYTFKPSFLHKKLFCWAQPCLIFRIKALGKQDSLNSQDFNVCLFFQNKSPQLFIKSCQDALLLWNLR